jgi:hypothetical protein
MLPDREILPYHCPLTYPSTRLKKGPIMRAFILPALAILLAAPAFAQDLDPRWEPMGEMTVTLDGTEYEMMIPFDTKKDRPYASEREIIGRRSFNILGSVVTPEGKPGKPRLQITFFLKDDQPDLISMEVYDDQGFRKPLTISPDAGTGDFTAFEITADREITASFAGEMMRMDNSDPANPQLAEDAAPMTVMGRIRVTVPPPK